jgi:hypothetical protein
MSASAVYHLSGIGIDLTDFEEPLFGQPELAGLEEPLLFGKTRALEEPLLIKSASRASRTDFGSAPSRSSARMGRVRTKENYQ